MELKRSDNSPRVTAYVPYYREQAKREIIPFAVNLYESELLEGERQVEGGASVPFVATWRGSGLPSEAGLIIVTFDNNPELRYEVVMNNSEFVGYLIDIIIAYRNKNTIDFPKIFYSKLFRIKIASESN
jgi:hypothetical protein